MTKHRGGCTPKPQRGKHLGYWKRIYWSRDRRAEYKEGNREPPEVGDWRWVDGRCLTWDGMAWTPTDVPENLPRKMMF